MTKNKRLKFRPIQKQYINSLIMNIGKALVTEPAGFSDELFPYTL